MALSFSYLKHSRPIPLNAYLNRLILGALVPLLIFSIFMMVLFARQEQASRRRGLESTARALILAVDQEIKSSITTLEALATAEPLDVGAVRVFREVAARIFDAQNNWQGLALFDPQGSRLVAIAKPDVAETWLIHRASLEGVLRTRLPMIDDLPAAGDSNGSAISIHVPVVRDRTVIYILSAFIDPRAFTEILAQQKIPGEWLGTLFDSKQLIIARSREAKQYFGKPIGPLLKQTNSLVDEQFLRGVADGGNRAYAAVSRSRLTGWFFALSVPSSEVNAILYRSLATVGGGGFLLLFIGLGVALVFAGEAAKSIKEFSSAAHDLGRGKSVQFPASSPIEEIDDLGREMERAASLLREREEERDRVEAALRKQEEDLQRQADLLNLANEAIFARQLDGRIIYWNRGAEQLYGYSEAEAIDSLTHELLATEFPKGWDHFGASLLAAGEWSGELKQRTKYGRRIDVESRFKLIDDRAGSYIILECNRDITHRKQSARRLATEHRMTLALAESENPEVAWSRTLEIIGAGLDWDAGSFWLIDKQSQMLECRQSWHDPSKNFTDCDDRPSLPRGIGLPGRVWQTEEPVWIPDIVKEASTLQLALPGDNVHAIFAFPIKLGNEVLGVIEFFSTEVRPLDTDSLRTAQAIGGEIGQFAERMRAEAALRQSEEHLRNQAQELEQQLLASGRLVAVGELTASMAHEFNNPLGIILGFAQSLLDTLSPSDPNYQHVQIIAEEAKRCEKLVQELLEFGRPKSSDFVVTDVEQIIQRTMSLVQPHAAKNRVETAVDVSVGLPQIYADPQQLQQILLNLGLNALDAMPKGGTLTMTASSAAAGSIVITVSDTGMGIDKDVMPRIFQAFFTSKKRRGLGLGLPICDRIAKSHGGTIKVESKPGEGTTFKVYLPLIPPGANVGAITENPELIIH
jgi:two-component system cell cycle sensor histidine kinase/response regulator CckA